MSEKCQNVICFVVFLLLGVFVSDGQTQSISQPQLENVEVEDGVVPVVVTTEEAESEAEEEQIPGLSLPDTNKVRVKVSFMAAYIHDGAVASLGFEGQGRVGYGIVSILGNLNDQFSYMLEVNPVNESEPLPACGEEGFFFPNTPQNFGPRVTCDPNGRLRVDDYRFIALDPMNQQGPIRQAYLRYQKTGFGLQFGRFILPIGFNWEEVGSFTAKDATHIQRINTESNFGIGLDYSFGRASITAAGFLGDGNKFRDYDYFYFQDGSLDSNSALTALLSGSVDLVEGLDLRASWKKGFTGSKVERLPNFGASKRNDNALVLSLQYRANRFARVFGEYARYTWGLTKTSAELLGLDPSPVIKPGYYVGTDLSVPIGRSLRVGTVVTREELTRDDSLISLLSQQGHSVELGKKERATVYRFYADISDIVTVAVIRNNMTNPYPWVSGIQSIPGLGSGIAERGSNKWGLVVRFRVE